MPTGFNYGGNTILSHPIFVETILPFLLVFTIVFAILQKSEIFGKGKKQVDAIVGLVIGLIVISFAQATGIILQMIVFLSVGLVIILVLLLLLGIFAPEKKLTEMFPRPLQIVMIVVVVLAVTTAVVYITNAWQYIYDWIFIGSQSSIFLNILFVIIIIAAIAAVLLGTNRSGD